MNTSIQQFLIDNNYQGVFSINTKLSRYSWLQVGGVAEYFFIPHSIYDVSLILKIKNNHPIFILGAGSNTLIRDGGIKGFVLWMGQINNIDALTETKEFVCVRAGAGLLNKKFVSWCQDNGWGGAEFMAGIPGTIGGGVFMNAECHKYSFGDHIESVEGVTFDGLSVGWKHEQVQWNYRKAIFPEAVIVTHVVFKLFTKNKDKIAEDTQNMLQIRKNTQPIGQMSCGCMFKNPQGDLKAWQLIDACGLRGFQKNNAQISTMHSNFLINNEDATASDLEDVGLWAQKCVLEKFHIELEWEIERVGIRAD